MPATIGENNNIGAQVAYWRQKRGKNQRVLAGLAGISQPYLSNIERGIKAVNTRGTLAALANALDVSIADLTGRPGDPTDPTHAAAASHVPAIREALIRREVGELTEPHHDVRDLMIAGGRYDFAAVAPQLPSMLGGLRGGDLVQVAHVATYTLKHLGHPDLARDAARLAVAEARELGDPAWIGIAEFVRILAMPPEMPGAPTRLAQRVADEIQPHIGDPQARQAYGMLHLHAALRAAVDRRGELAHDHLREAGDAAESLGEPEDLGLARFAFGPTNVGFWTVAVELELGEPHRAIEAADEVAPGRLPIANRQAPYFADVATALSQVGRDHESIAMMLRSEAAGPQWFRLRPTVRDTVGAVVRRTKRNAITKPMRHAAVAVGLSDLVKD
ncbi:transcriptional regulator [Actinoplanes lobatus]|uniref:Transcriptional regulator n=1 Tax=Actinoplanes lobatus TaxID=113568 RepID=A0A7W7MG65_9ACTN|nr:helix-turn-helix domain-containing protein [Actinoplanes lobatus]MBB4749117.1 transcriptional regulator with XRE-family HTH domain [Actinoplanes lobatus]GGN86437.1 transcriptional regulator [Actinoplanes lobatus]GIE42785.1 transcriptional regulator [Actinoplanes lobatus]